MEEEYDFRSDPMDTVEGTGQARYRYDSFWDGVDEDILAVVFGRPYPDLEDYPPDVQDDIFEDAVVRSELIGFWVTWHLSGGFANLERGGWHRATIFRKVRRFRAIYGAHPDVYRFSWITLDLRKEWTDQINSRLELEGSDLRLP